jgi:very-short-patch-repair endonuclease
MILERLGPSGSLVRLIAMEIGVYSRPELQQRGLDGWQLRTQVRDGSLIRLRPGWYSTPTADAVVVEAVRRGGALGCVSALRHHGLWVPPGYDRVHVRTSKYNKTQGIRSCQGHGRPLPVTTAVDPIPVALDCAARCMSAEDWIVVCDSALNSAGLTIPGLMLAMDTVAQRVSTLMGKCDPTSQSGTESITRLRLRAAGFTVIVQPAIPGVGRVDLRVGRLLIECDSRQHHTSLENYRNDRRRDRKALLDGWLTMRLTYDDVLYGWDEVLADIRSITRTDRHRIRTKIIPGSGDRGLSALGHHPAG